MRMKRWLISSVVAGMSWGAWGQPAATPATPAPGRVAKNENQQPDKPMERVLPEINFNGNSLSDVVDFLRDVVGPSFKVIVVHSEPFSDDPAITMRLKNVSLAQILEVMSKAYPIQIETIPPTTPRDTEVIMLRVFPSKESSTTPTPVHVYHLANLVDDAPPAANPLFARAGTQPNKRASKEDESLSGVLSVIQAALKQVPGEQPVLELHGATRTLIFKGSPQQRVVLEEVLDSLDPQRETNFAIVHVHPNEVQAQAEKDRAQMVEMENKLKLQEQLWQQRREAAAEETNRRAAQVDELMKRIEELRDRESSLNAKIREYDAVSAKLREYETRYGPIPQETKPQPPVKSQ